MGEGYRAAIIASQSNSRPLGVKLVKDVGFVDEGDDGVVFSMAPLGAGGIKVFAPDGVESGNEDALALDGEIGAVVLEVVDARIFQVAEKMARRAVLSVAERARSFVQSSESEDGSLMTKSRLMRIRSGASFFTAAIMPRVTRREEVLIRLGAGMDDFI